MAKSYFTCPKCGKSEKIEGRNSKDAGYRARRATETGKLCDACDHAEWQEKTAAKNAAALDAAKSAGWPELIGTEKQVPYAAGLRAEKLPRIEPLFAEWLDGAFDLVDCRARDAAEATVAKSELIDAANLLKMTWLAETSAKFWIEFNPIRDSITQSIDRDACPVLKSLTAR